LQQTAFEVPAIDQDRRMKKHIVGSGSSDEKVSGGLDITSRLVCCVVKKSDDDRFVEFEMQTQILM
jgi:hypothetical protein